MEKTISKLIELAKGTVVSAEQRAEQRRSFVYGNTSFENSAITRALVDEAVAEEAKHATVKDDVLRA